MQSGYSGSGAMRGIVVATVVAGTLDLLSAFGFAAWVGASPLGVLGGIGSAVVDRGVIGNPWIMAGIGLALHFGIMAVMATVYFLGASVLRLVNRLWWLCGLLYGAALWGVMERVVLPWRWPTLFPVAGTAQLPEQLFDHLILVGLTIAWSARRAGRWRRARL